VVGRLICSGCWTVSSRRLGGLPERCTSGSCWWIATRVACVWRVRGAPASFGIQLPRGELFRKGGGHGEPLFVADLQADADTTGWTEELGPGFRTYLGLPIRFRATSWGPDRSHAPASRLRDRGGGVPRIVCRSCAIALENAGSTGGAPGDRSAESGGSQPAKDRRRRRAESRQRGDHGSAGRIEYVNPKFSQVTGYRSEER